MRDDASRESRARYRITLLAAARRSFTQRPRVSLKRLQVREEILLLFRRLRAFSRSALRRALERKGVLLRRVRARRRRETRPETPVRIFNTNPRETQRRGVTRPVHLGAAPLEAGDEPVELALVRRANLANLLSLRVARGVVSRDWPGRRRVSRSW